MGYLPYMSGLEVGVAISAILGLEGLVALPIMSWLEGGAHIYYVWARGRGEPIFYSGLEEKIHYLICPD